MKKILQVRFVNFGAGCVYAIESCGLNLTDSPFIETAEPQVCTRDITDFQNRTSEWIETLNSGDASVPRITEDSGGGYSLTTEDSILVFGYSALHAFNQIYGKEAEIYTPKKYEAKWKQLYPREFGLEDFEDAPNGLGYGYVNHINLLQQTESGGLEVHELIVYEV